MSAHCRFGLLVALGLLAGCATHVRVLPKSTVLPGRHEMVQIARQPWWLDEPTYRDLVQGHHLERLFRQNPDDAIQMLNEEVAGIANHEDVLAVISLTARYGKAIERRQPEKAASLYLAAATLAYRNLTTDAGSSASSPSNSPLLRAYNQVICPHAAWHFLKRHYEAQSRLIVCSEER